MCDKPFLDTNILLYSFSIRDPLKQQIAKRLVLQNAFISTQVINETSVNLIKKFHLYEKDIQQFIVSSYMRYTVMEITQEVLAQASHLREKYMLSYYDSTIIAAALSTNCTIIYSEDMQHQQLIEDKLTIINPFL